jgi:peptide/nickel transport system ATP-binding protein
MKELILETRDLSKRFERNGESVTALDRVSLAVAPGETLALVGPSGSGKSTLARVILRLLDPDAGEIIFEGGDFLALRGAALRRKRARLQMVFQDPLSALNPRASVARVIADPLRVHGIASRAGRPAAVAALLARVGLPADLAGRAVHEISGGQRQRVAIARAIATRPALIVLDEAVSALDVSVRKEILALLAALQRDEGIAYLFVTHDLGVARAVAHRVAIMDRGRIVETGDARAVIADPRSPTGRALVAAAPRLKR